jgi:hypothetical protein
MASSMAKIQTAYLPNKYIDEYSYNIFGNYDVSCYFTYKISIL